MEPTPRNPHPARLREEPISVRGPAALAAALPYLFDRPLDCTAVVSAIRPDSTLSFAASSGLPSFPEGASPEVLRQWARDVGRLAAQGVRGMGPGGDGRLAVVLYLPPAFGQPPQWFGPVVMAQGLACDDSLLDVVAVFADRWRSLACTSERCCPAAGAVILDNSDAALVAAELVAAGMSVATQDPTAALAPRVAGLLAAMSYPTSVKARRRLLRRSWPAVLRPGPGPDAETVATLIMAADRPGVRDALLTRMARRAQDDGFWQEQAALWSAVVQAAPHDWLAGPACMLGIARWSMGDAVAADLAVAVALKAEPSHRMANLIGSLLAQQASAASWFSRMQGIAEGDCLRFDRPPPQHRTALPRQPRAAG